MPRTKEQFEKLRNISRQKILDAAMEVFATEGYHSSTISLISKKAGISKGLIYNYFSSKEELLHELMIGMMKSMIEELMPVKQGEKFSRDDVIYLVNKSIDLVLEKPKYWKLYTSVFIQLEVMALVIDKIMEMAQPYMNAMTEYFKEKGEKDPVTIMRYFSAVMDGIQMHLMIDPKTFPVEKVRKMLIDQFT